MTLFDIFAHLVLLLLIAAGFAIWVILRMLQLRNILTCNHPKPSTLFEKS
jgi:hypothetical protein